MRLLPALILLAACHVAAVAAETTDASRLPNVVVIEDTIDDPAMSPVTLPDNNHALGIDGAEIIRSLAGVSAGRFGGHGLEPVIRGQSQGRLNVRLDGASVHGGCPNRMDPPTSFMGVQSYDRVTVLKGVQTLVHGAGGSGGTVLFERNLAPPRDGFSGSAGLSTSTNGVDGAVFADITAGNDRLFVRAIGSRNEAGNYEDGNGRDVRSAFTTTSGTLALGYRPDRDSRFELTLESVRTDDALFPGAGMDAPEDRAGLVRLRAETPVFDGGRLRADAWYSGVDHLMDNYSERQRTAPMAMRVPSDSDTVGTRAFVELPLASDWSLTTGFDAEENRRDAVRYAGPDETSVNSVNAYLWPDVTLRQVGLVAEAARGEGGPNRWRLGARLDRVTAQAGKAALDPAGPPAAPSTLYDDYYGADADKRHETNLGLLARFEHQAHPGVTWFAGASRTMRSADTTERFIASTNPANPAARWIGNPGLDPEAHHQVDAGLTLRGAGWSASSVVYVDEVRDYILRDRARGQDGVLRDDGATVYRNVDARLLGAELSGEAVIDRWTLSAGLSYVHADNRDDNRPLAQIPPLNGYMEAAWTSDRWAMGARWSLAASQPRVDDDRSVGSGLDAGKTPGYGVLDLHASVRTGLQGELRLGVRNLFDRAYADHLNRANQDPFNPDPVQVNEPGRSLWASWRSLF